METDTRVDKSQGHYEVEANSAPILMTLSELVRRKLLYRTGTTERLDSTTSFKCNLGQDVVARFAKELGVNLQDWIWDVDP